MRRALNVVKRIFTVRSCNYDMPKQMPERPCLDYYIKRCKAPCILAQTQGEYRGDDRRGARLSRRADATKSCAACASGWTLAVGVARLRARRRAARRASTISSRWKSRRSCCRSRAAIATCRLCARRRRRGDRADAHPRRQAARARASVPREHRGGDRRGGARGVSRRAVSAARGPRGGAARAVRPEERELVEASLERHEDPSRRSAARGASSSTSRRRTRGICSRSCGSPATRPRSAPAIRSTSCSGSSDCRKCRASLVCFDISHAQGTDTVASCVWFQNGRPYRAEYRKFKVKTVEGIDDFASMHEVVTRYFTRRLEEEKPLPDLVVIDGGKGQLNAAHAALEALGLGAMPIISLAKREEEIFVLGRTESLRLPRRSPALARAAAGARRGASLRDHLPAEASLDAYDHVGAAAHSRRRRSEASPAARRPSAACRAFATRRRKRSPRSRASAEDGASASSMRCSAARRPPRQSSRRRPKQSGSAESQAVRHTSDHSIRHHVSTWHLECSACDDARIGRRARDRLPHVRAAVSRSSTIRPCRRATR